MIKELDRRGIAYLHLIEARGSEIGLTDELHENAVNNAELFRPIFDGAVEKKHADAIAFGRLFIANPDLVERIIDDSSLAKPDRSTFYGGGAHGYIDYKMRGIPNERSIRL